MNKIKENYLIINNQYVIKTKDIPNLYIEASNEIDILGKKVKIFSSSLEAIELQELEENKFGKVLVDEDTYLYGIKEITNDIYIFEDLCKKEFINKYFKETAEQYKIEDLNNESLENIHYTQGLLRNYQNLTD